MAEIDGGTWGNILLGASTVGAGLMWAREKWFKLKVESANTDVAVVTADAQQLVYTMLMNRLETLEKEMQGVRQELATERAHSRALEIHIFKLEAVMRKANIEVPLFEGSKG